MYVQFHFLFFFVCICICTASLVWVGICLCMCVIWWMLPIFYINRKIVSLVFPGNHKWDTEMQVIWNRRSWGKKIPSHTYTQTHTPQNNPPKKKKPRKIKKTNPKPVKGTFLPKSKPKTHRKTKQTSSPQKNKNQTNQTPPPEIQQKTSELTQNKIQHPNPYKHKKKSEDEISSLKPRISSCETYEVW